MMLAIERDERDPFVLSASVASAIVTNRPFLDGNKRAAYLVSLRMLEKNGIIIDPDVAAAAEIFTDMAADKRTGEDLLAWLRQQVSCHSDDVKASTRL
jgi:death-on-curing protein